MGTSSSLYKACEESSLLKEARRSATAKRYTEDFPDIEASVVDHASRSAENSFRSNRSNTASQGPFLDIVRFSLGAEEAEPPTFYCAICMENVDIRERYCFSGQPCGHNFCRDCLKGYLTVEILQGEIRSRCPLSERDLCENWANEKDISTICDQEELRKYRRFKQLRATPSACECPHCGHIQEGRWFRRRMMCRSCGGGYCYFHGGAHPPDGSCLDYSRRQWHGRLKTSVKLFRTTKKCPGCHFRTEKAGGCNQMTCPNPVCRRRWCFVCGRFYQEGHYDVLNLRGCPGAMFVDAGAGTIAVHKAFLVLGLCAMALASVVTGAAFAAVYLVASPMLCCAVACQGVPPRALAGRLAVPPLVLAVLAAALLWLALAFAWFLAVVAVWVACFPATLLLWRLRPGARITLRTLPVAPLLCLRSVLRARQHPPPPGYEAGGECDGAAADEGGQEELAGGGRRGGAIAAWAAWGGDMIRGGSQQHLHQCDSQDQQWLVDTNQSFQNLSEEKGNSRKNPEDEVAAAGKHERNSELLQQSLENNEVLILHNKSHQNCHHHQHKELP